MSEKHGEDVDYEDLPVDEEDVIISVQCKGSTIDGYECLKKVAIDITAQDKAYCKLHVSQQKGALPLRRCDGMTAKNEPCTRPLPTSSRTKVSFCALHRDQRDYIDLIRCFAKRGNGKLCGKIVRWVAPFHPFCPMHLSQAQTFGCAITNLPNDIASAILKLLKPVDRVSFALANKSCAKIVRSWAGSAPTPNHLRKANLLVQYVIYPEPSAAAIPSTPGVDTPIPKPTPTGIDHRCGREYTFHLLHPHPELKKNQPENPSKFTRTLLAFPYLFRSDSESGICMRCYDQLDSGDSKEWNKYHGHFHYSKWLEQGNPKEMLLCKRCIHRDIRLLWCKECHGEASPLAIARAYWKTQKKPVYYISSDDESREQEERYLRHLRNRLRGKKWIRY